MTVVPQSRWMGNLEVAEIVDLVLFDGEEGRASIFGDHKLVIRHRREEGKPAMANWDPAGPGQSIFVLTNMDTPLGGVGTKDLEIGKTAAGLPLVCRYAAWRTGHALIVRMYLAVRHGG